MTTSARLVVATAVLFAVDLGGGLLAVASGVNTWSEAWGGKALLAAPLPMIAIQALLVWLAVRRPGRPGSVASGLLAAACVVSVASGFFDGGLGNDELSSRLAAYQVLLLAVTGVVGVLALARLRELVVRKQSARSSQAQQHTLVP